MFNFIYITKEDVKKHNPNWPDIPNHQYKILIVGGSKSGETNALLNLINVEADIDIEADPYEAKYQMFMKKRESTGLKYLNDSKILLNTQIIWMIYIKIFKNITQIKKVKYCI